MVGSPENVITQFLGISHGVPGTPGSGDNDDGFYSTGLRVATAAELQIWLEKSNGIPVLQQPGSDYTLDLTNPACAVIGFDTTGGLPQPPYPVLPDPGDIITCVRLTALTQTLNLRYGERLPSGLLEASLDKILRIIADTRAVKTLRFPVTDPLDQECELPGSLDRAGRILGFDDDGNLTVYPVVEIGETETDAYRGDRGVVAYNHSQLPHAPSDATKGADWNSNVANKPALLALGQTESTAHRGDLGHAAYQHACSPHAPMPGTAAAKNVEFFATAEQGVDERVPTEAGLAAKFGELNKPTPVDADRFCGINKQGPTYLNHPFHTTWEQIKAFFATAAQGALADTAVQPEDLPAPYSGVAGGVQDQVLTKLSDDDFDAGWVTPVAAKAQLAMAAQSAEIETLTSVGLESERVPFFSPGSKGTLVLVMATWQKVKDFVLAGFGDVVTHDASEFATAAQGSLADTALQIPAYPGMYVELSGDRYYDYHFHEITPGNLHPTYISVANDTIFRNYGVAFWTLVAGDTTFVSDDVVSPDQAHTWTRTAGTGSVSNVIPTAPMYVPTARTIGGVDLSVDRSLADLGAATAAQGALADTAVQPEDLPGIAILASRNFFLLGL